MSTLSYSKKGDLRGATRRRVFVLIVLTLLGTALSLECNRRKEGVIRVANGRPIAWTGILSSPTLLSLAWKAGGAPQFEGQWHGMNQAAEQFDPRLAGARDSLAVSLRLPLQVEADGSVSHVAFDVTNIGDRDIVLPAFVAMNFTKECGDLIRPYVIRHRSDYIRDFGDESVVIIQMDCLFGSEVAVLSPGESIVRAMRWNPRTRSSIAGPPRRVLFVVVTFGRDYHCFVNTPYCPPEPPTLGSWSDVNEQMVHTATIYLGEVESCSDGYTQLCEQWIVDYKAAGGTFLLFPRESP